MSKLCTFPWKFIFCPINRYNILWWWTRALGLLQLTVAWNYLYLISISKYSLPFIETWHGIIEVWHTSLQNLNHSDDNKIFQAKKIKFDGHFRRLFQKEDKASSHQFSKTKIGRFLSPFVYQSLHLISNNDCKAITSVSLIETLGMEFIEFRYFFIRSTNQDNSIATMSELGKVWWEF